MGRLHSKGQRKPNEDQEGAGKGVSCNGQIGQTVRSGGQETGQSSNKAQPTLQKGECR